MQVCIYFEMELNAEVGTELDVRVETASERERRTDEERLWFDFFLMTGMREQEVMYTYWSDMNLAASTIRVSQKPDRKWTPKAHNEREIPIPAKLGEEVEGTQGEG